MQDLVLMPTPLQNRDSKLLLASGSFSRRKMLEDVGLDFDVQVGDVNESILKTAGQREGWRPEAVALALAEAKALSVQQPGAFVIGADQMLSCDSIWYDKPKDLAQARAQLLALRGNTHILHTAVVICRNGQVLWQHVDQPRLTMRLFSETFLNAYLQTEGTACLASVGAYRLEGPGLQLFAHVEGDAFSIQGLPLLPLLEALREMNVIFY
ncbi:semialdehyde dehydrogenase [Acetobacter pomorum]|uniref:Nucleoside triphosphate pyrophosphatase n=1 Tax=Acetobacter pomorum TaxID=65959 RepID=A0A2G4REV2_9PROT|nr:Maf family protein [Acetobacter pomorum]PHY95020.1 semialdehyde dehydrogenase [Acetobacter pomorum]GBR51219.1 septum formation inhibitor nucleotide-binding protein Maf [Acetobacter pomorum DSM 11825]